MDRGKRVLDLDSREVGEVRQPESKKQKVSKLATMADGEVLIVFHFDGQLEWDKFPLVYNGGDKKMMYVSSKLTYNSLIESVLKATSWIMDDGLPYIEYLHHNGRAFTLISIRNDDDTRCMFKASGADTNALYLYVRRNCNKVADHSHSLSRMGDGEVLIVFHFDGQLEWDKFPLVYNGGDKKMMYVSSKLTYNLLIESVLKATSWIMDDGLPYIEYLHHNGRAFTLISIRNDDDTRCMFKASGADTNALYLYVRRNCNKVADHSHSLARPSLEQIEGPDGRNLQLCFRTRLTPPLFTGTKVEGQQGAAICVELIDKRTSHVVTSGPGSSAKLDVVVLEGDFNNEDDDDWTQEDFEHRVVKERKGKGPLLTGNLQVLLKEGVGLLGELTFTDNSSWIPSKKFRLAVKVASGFCEGIRVREAKTDAFSVIDHRGESYKKHYPPTLDDKVWRLEMIRKDGSFHKKLNKAGICTVQDFLGLAVRDSQRLRNILGGSMMNKKWDILLEHANKCVVSRAMHYVYYAEDTKNTGVVFNSICEFSGLIADGQYYSAKTLSGSLKVLAEKLVKKAYDNWMDIVEFDAPLNMEQYTRASSSRTEVVIKSPAVYSVSFDHEVSLSHLPSSVPSLQAFVRDSPVSSERQLSLPCLPSPSPSEQAFAIGDYNISSEQRVCLERPPSPVLSEQAFSNLGPAISDYTFSSEQQVSLPPRQALVPSEQGFVNSVLAVEGGMIHDENRYPVNDQMQLESNSFGRETQLTGFSHLCQSTRNGVLNGPALEGAESATYSGFRMNGASVLSSKLGSDDDDQLNGYNYGSVRSWEYVDDQQLISFFSEGAFNDHPYSSMDSSSEVVCKSSVIAVVRFLIALRRGVFIWKQAAEKRAQAQRVVLED